MTERMERRVEEGKDPLDAALEVVADAIRASEKILFEGDAYTAAWRTEAESRGLIRSRTTPETIDLMLGTETIQMLEELGIYKKREIEAIHEIRLESFCTALEVEMSTMHDMLYEGILPAISKQMLLERSSLSAMDGVDFPEADAWRALIQKLGTAKAALLRKADALREMRARVDAMPIRARADAIEREAVPLMAEIRKMCDEVEILMAADIQPYPIYRSLLSLSV